MPINQVRGHIPPLKAQYNGRCGGHTYLWRRTPRQGATRNLIQREFLPRRFAAGLLGYFRTFGASIPCSLRLARSKVLKPIKAD